MSNKAKEADCEPDRQSIDIFIFSNGQQYSPPRKYHLRMADLNLWTSTLQYLAQTHYGPSHSSVDLYTLGGQKLAGPVELCNGTSYVAVATTDVFVDAGYDKYLIRATRSWEKRQASKTESLEREESGNNVKGPEQIRVENFNLKPLNDSATLKTVVSSMVDDDTSVITKPQISLGSQPKTGLLLSAAGTIKPIDKKKPPIQRSSLNKKIVLSTPVSNLKPTFKKNEVAKSVNTTKKPRPEFNNRLSSTTDCNNVNKLMVKNKMMKPTIKPKEPPIRSQGVLPKVQEVANELKSSSIKTTDTDNVSLSQKFANYKSTIEDNEALLAPAIALIPTANYYDPIKQQTTTEISDETFGQVRDNLHLNSDVQIGIPISNMTSNFSTDKNHMHLDKEMKQNDQKNDKSEKLLIKYPTYPTHSIIHKVEEYADLVDEVTIVSTENNDNVRIHDSSPQNHIVNTNNMSNRNITNETEGNLYCNELVISTSGSSKATNFQNPQNLGSSMIDGKVFVGEYKNLGIEETHGLTLTSIETSSNDQHMVKFLKKSGIVNINIKIEIDNGNNIINNVISTNTEKGSQSNIDEQLYVTENKSLFSLTVKEVNNINKTNNHHFIIIQCGGCKFCNGRSGTAQNVYSTKNDEKAEGKIEGYNDKCNEFTNHPDIRFYNFPSAGTMCSCKSPEIISNPNQRQIPKENASQIICATNQNTTLNITEDVVSVSRKKSVTISEDSAAITQELSKISQEVVTKSQFYAVDSLQVPKTTVDSSIQTEWCDVLLEARALEGGHYTFWLPSIETLKFYKLT